MLPPSSSSLWASLTSSLGQPRHFVLFLFLQLDLVELTLSRGSIVEATKLDQVELTLPRGSTFEATKLDQVELTLPRGSTAEATKGKLSEPTKNLWHSSPLEQKEHEKCIGDEFSASIVRSA
ncbi:hypothetical protein JHK85_001133 [Glycine max]|nr:hypothetical protein JHK85_001133 [Glycine max]KAG5088487.1 hypothetical protein JHK86_001099 [Glycine max]